ncbi:MAG: 4-hydroxybenzoate octaprenyltransferase [Pseudomonadota bacterium]
MQSVQSKTNQGRVADAPTNHWVYRIAPQSLWPYAQLARWDRPIGWWLLLWPCWWAAAMAPFSIEGTTSFPNVFHLVLFLIGAIAMRGAGCTFNDIVDRDIDEKVERTRSRPLPSGQVKRANAVAFLGVQLLAGLLVLLQFNTFSILLGFCAMLPVAIYPFMKRVTNWPQLFLGFAFSWGALMGWAALHGSLSAAPILLYIGCIAWTIGYDTIYAHQDKEDDAVIGVKSTALLFGDQTKAWLAGLYGLMLVLFASAFAIATTPWPAFAGLALAAIHLGRQIVVLDVNDAEQCLSLFRSNYWVGWIIFGGLIASAFVA